MPGLIQKQRMAAKRYMFVSVYSATCSQKKQAECRCTEEKGGGGSISMCKILENEILLYES